MRILLVTSSARGHALAEALHRSAHKPEIIHCCPSRNPGIRALATEQHVLDIMNFPAILDVAKKTKPDFAVIGPDDPIGSGLADALQTIGIKSFAPKKSLARIESSKGFARELMQKHGIDASPKFRVFTSPDRDAIEAYIRNDLESEYVVKYDGLKGGKGVKVSGAHLSSVEEGVAYAIECINEGGRVVIEEKLIGVEFSLLSFVSGTQTADMPPVQDHKPAYEGDTGPNTGGMGTYTDADHSLPFLTAEDLQAASAINKRVAAALQKECGSPFTGILYGGFIAVKNGIRVIEYNARFGDPEALNLLPLLETDFVDVCKAVIDGTLDSLDVRFAKKATVCKYIVPKSYPEAKTEKGQPVTFPKELPENARLYYGDISEDESGGLHLGGSRTAGIVGIGNSIEEAEATAQALCDQVDGPVRFRRDVGTSTLIEKRIEMMKTLRS